MKEPYLILEEEVALWADIFPATAITVRSRPHAPAPTPEQCEKRNCLECPLWDKCSVMEYMPMCSRATYDGVRKNAARAATLAENKRVLDKMAYWLKSNRCPPTKKKGDGCDGGCGMCMIESLRNTAAQEEK
jgi:hypothetical protein